MIAFIGSELCEALSWPIYLGFFQIHPNSKFQKSSFNQVLSGFTIDPNKNLIVGNAEHLMAVETSFTTYVILDM